MRYFRSVSSTIGNQFWNFYYYAKNNIRMFPVYKDEVKNKIKGKEVTHMYK